MSELPFRIAVYDKAFNRLGWVGAPKSLAVTVRHNVVSTATLVMDGKARLVGDLMAEGSRVVIEYKGAHLLSGMVRLRGGSGPMGEATFQVVDDFRLLHRILGWPMPGFPLGGQSSAYDVRSGPAETVVKGVVAANAVSRLGLPVTVATDLGRGADIEASFRFHPLYDRLFPAVDQAGIGVTVRQSDAGLVLDCYEPATYPRTLSASSGVVQEWGYSLAAPEATRVVVGDQGEAEARSFTGGVDAARELLWGDVVEVFRDARDTDEPSVVAARIAEALAEGAAKAGVRVALAETTNFSYDPTGTHGVRVGDVVSLDVGLPVLVTDVLREADLSWTADDGLVVRPVVGERSDDPSTVLTRAIGAVARAVRELRVR